MGGLRQIFYTDYYVKYCESGERSFIKERLYNRASEIWYREGEDRK